MFKKILIGLAVVLVLLVGAVLILPSFVDWNAYKDRIAAQVEQATGRTLTIGGDMTLQVLPSPRLTAERVTLANAPGGQAENMVELETLEVAVALPPLLSGEVQVQSIVLVGPTVYLERLADGSSNWSLDAAAPAGEGSGAGGDASGGAASGAEPAGAPDDGPGDGAGPGEDTGPGEGAGGDGFAITLDSLSIENGTVVYRDLTTGEEIVVDELEAEVAADTLQGPFTGEGSAVADGRRLAFEVRTGRLGDGATPVGLEVTLPEAAESALTFSGTLDAQSAAVDGDLQVRGRDLARLAAEVWPATALPAPFGRSFALDTELSYGRDRLELVGLQLTLGDISATGDVDLQVAPQIDGRVALNVSRLDLDALLADSRGGGGGQSAAPGGGFELPAGMNVGFELIVDALVYNGEVVRQVLVNGQLAEGRVQLQQALALLPGGGDVSVSGSLATPEGQPRFDGQVEAASDNLRGLAEWLDLELPDVPPDRLRRASLSTAVAYVPAQVQLTGIVLEVDSVTAQGGVTVALGRAKPAFGAGLTIDRLNLDAYMPGGGGSSVRVAQTAQSEAQAEAAEGDAAGPSPNPLQAFNANLNLRVGTLIYGGQQAGDIALQARVQDGVLAVQSLEIGDLVGGSASFAGTVSGLPETPTVSDGTFSLNVPDTTRLARLLNQPADGPIAGLGSLNANGTLSGHVEDVTADITAQLPEGPVSFAGRVRTSAGTPRIDNGRVSLELSDMQRLAQVAGLGDSPVARLGPVQAQGQIAGTPGDLTLDLGGALLGGRMTAAGRILQADGAVQVENLRVTADDVQGARLADLVGPQAETLRELGPLDLDTTMNGSPSAELRYETQIGLLGGQLGGQGTATGLADPDFSFDFAASASLPELRSLLIALGAGPAVRDGVALQANARIGGTPLNVQVAELNGNLGPTSLSGSLAANMTGARPAVTATVALGELPLDRILDDSLGGGGGQSAPRWSTEPLPLDALGALNAEVELTAQSISRGTYALQNAALSLSLDNRVLRIAPLTGQTLGGSIRLTSVVDARDARAAGIDLDFSGTDLQTQQLVPEGSQASGRVSGPLTVQLTANTLGASEAQLVENLNGQGSTGGSLTIQARAEEQAANVLLGILGQQISELRGLTETVNTVFNAFAGAPAQLDGTFAIEQGVVRTQDLSLQGRNAVARATGVPANLPAWAMDLTVDLFRNAERQPYLTVLLQGALDEPNVRLRGQPLQRQQERQPAPTTDGQQPAPDQPPQQEQAQPEQPQSPEDVLREEGEKLLRGLFDRLQ